MISGSSVAVAEQLDLFGLDEESRQGCRRDPEHVEPGRQVGRHVQRSKRSRPGGLPGGERQDGRGMGVDAGLAVVP